MQRYHPVARYLHWSIAALVVLQVVLARLAENAATPPVARALLENHQSVGLTVFVLAIARLAWRLWQGVPRPLPMPAWQLTAARASHWSMYVLILVLPVSGWLMSSASGIAVRWFGLLPLPPLAAADPALGETLESLHVSLAYLLFLIAVVHLGAALKHALFGEHPALARMTSAGTLVLFTAIVAAGIGWLVPDARRDGEPARHPARPAAPAAWNIDYGKSYIRFTAMQAGAPFEGEWQDWRATLRFDAAQLEASLFDVRVAAASVATGDDGRDRTLLDPDWFDVQRFPEIRFRASSFRRGPDGGFAAAGVLTVKGRQAPVVFTFDLIPIGGRRVLAGQAVLDRLALQVGTGEWADTRWIGREVGIVVHVETTD